MYEDATIFVRLDGTMGDDEYSVIPITGSNKDGKELVKRPVSSLSRKAAFDIAHTLIYALNGAVGRTSGEPEFTGHTSDS